jgi:hypothetical protein
MADRNGPDWRAGPWCTKCGHPSGRTGSTLDPTRPLGVCGRGTVERPGCGRVTLTTSLAEAEAVFDRRRAARITGSHRRHRPEVYPIRDCAKCRVFQVAALPNAPP